MRRAAVRVAVVLLALLAASPAWAEHEVFYRYTVIGYVKDDRGRPLRGREITVVREKTGFSYLGESDENGLYVVILRLGDESVGESLAVRGADAAARIVVRFRTDNHTDERGTRLDLEGAHFVERSAWFASTLARFLGASR